MIKPIQDSSSTGMARILRGLLRPLVRMLIARGVTAPAFYRLLKQVYVEVASDQFRLNHNAPTDSRISLLTGVHRRDVRDIRSAGSDPWSATQQKTTIFSTVIGHWIAAGDFTDGSGKPLDIARSGEEGRDFESLVRSINRDVRPRTVLDELLRLGMVTELEDGKLRLDASDVVGPASDDHKMTFFAANVGDHLAAAAENMLVESPPFLERAVFYNNLSAASVDEIEQEARDGSQFLLEQLNKSSLMRQSKDRGEDGSSQRYRFGVYFFREEQDETKNKNKGD